MFNKSKGYLSLIDEKHYYKLFDMLQFHFHSPSEHTFDGRHYDLEMHVVHKRHGVKEGGAVLAIFFDRLKGGDEFNPFIDSLNLTKDLKHKKISPAPLKELIEIVRMHNLYTYSGSYTVPPCEETLTWLVTNDP